MKEAPKNGFWVIFQNEIILQELAPSQLLLGVAGRHRAYPSVSLDKFPYVVVFVTDLKLTMFLNECQTFFHFSNNSW